MTVPQDNNVWRKASRSETQGACVELGSAGAIRDSKNVDGSALALSWTGLVAAVKADRLSR